MSNTANRQMTSNLVRKTVEYLLSKLVNQHTKRIIFVTSLYTRVTRLEKLQQSAVVKLNQLMVLATNEDSLPFGSRLQRVIWKQTDIRDILTPEILSHEISEDQARELSVRVVDKCPKWLRYNKPAMILDVQKLLQQSSELLGGHEMVGIHG